MQNFIFAFAELRKAVVCLFLQAVQVFLDSRIALQNISHFLCCATACELAWSALLDKQVSNKDIKQHWPQDQPLSGTTLATVHQTLNLAVQANTCLHSKLTYPVLISRILLQEYYSRVWKRPYQIK